VIGRSPQCDLAYLRALSQIELRRPAAGVAGLSESNPSALKLCSTSRTRSGLVKVTVAIAGTSMPCADSSTICARRQVTTEPEPRRTVRSSRLPSSLVIS
jgi:hypothetical protein